MEKELYRLVLSDGTYTPWNTKEDVFALWDSLHRRDGIDRLNADGSIDNLYSNIR